MKILLVIVLIAAVAILVVTLSNNGTGTVSETPIPNIAVEKHTLANGLDVLFVEDHRLPRVAVNVWYHVGPVNEDPGRTGFAHLFEHMMFQKSKHTPEDSFFQFLEAAGATDMNGTTDLDRTNYFETVPSNELELALWLESDRMGYLLDDLTAESFKNQQDVVRNERRQSFENRPFGVVEEAVSHTLYPKEHPYYAAVIGSHADIQAAQLKDVKTFFKQYYVPNNASLAIVGDIDKAKTLQLVEKYFGSLKRGADVPPVTVTTPPITSERRLVVKDRVELPRLYMSWITAPIFTDDDAAGDLTANLLGGDKVSRLYKSLVYDKQIAQDASAMHLSYTLGSVFTIMATAAPGHTLEEIEAEINVQLDGLRTNTPEPAELDGAKRAIERSILFSLERGGGFGGVADRINSYNHHMKDPGFLQKDILRYRSATPQTVRDFAAKYLSNDSRVVVYGIPGEPDLGPEVPTPTAVADNEPPESVNADEPWRNERPEAGPTPAPVLPTPDSFAMSNGLTVILDRRAGLPTVAANLVFHGGSGANAPAQAGLAAFTLDMLDEGTATRSALQFAEQLKTAGAEIGESPNRDATSLSLTATKGTIAQALDLLADAILHPAFPDQEIERVRKTRLGELVQLKEDPSQVADRAMTLVVNGQASPYAYPILGTEPSVKSITAENLKGFWSEYMVPGNAAMIVSGDLTRDELQGLLEKSLGQWSNKTAPPSATPVAVPAAAPVIIIDAPGAPQTQLRVASPGPSRSTPDYPQLEVMNQILGGMFSSRINLNLRERNGYTYGAYSWIRYLQSGGWIAVAAGVRTPVTAPAVKEVLSEIAKMGDAPVSDQELTLAKASLIRTLPGSFETSSQTVGMLADLWVYSLPLSYYTEFPGKVEAVSAPVLQQVAKKYLDPSKFLVVLVGDQKAVGPELSKLGLGAIELRDADGNPVVSRQAAAR